MSDLYEERFYVQEPDADVSGAPKGWGGVVDEEEGGFIAFCRDEATALLLRDALREKHGVQ